jgi:asparagine synthetase B (glutamine-hydrolysing)
MTLFAGIFSRHEEQPIPDSVCDGLRRVLSRHPADGARTFRDARCFFVKTDIGAFAEEAFHVDETQAVSMLAGEALLNTGGKGAEQSRAQELEQLHESWKLEDWELLKHARGAFCAAHYEPLAGRLFLIPDKLCIRPLYYWADEKFVIFASALRVLESLDVIPKEMDLRGVTEMTGLGYPLGNRTPYAGISLLKAAEVVSVKGQSLTRHRYWRWDEMQPSRLTEDELLQEARQAFMRAVALRNRADKTTVAYLSGGLDSRCVVAALLELETRVHTFNFALPGTQDYILGNEFAREADTIHEALPKEPGDLTPDYSALMARAWASSKHRAAEPAGRPSIVWSGEGGSVAFGHVHLSREIVGQMRAGRTDEAVETFLQREGASVTRRLLQTAVSDELSPALHTGIREELDELRTADPARAFYLFLMLNDQRRKLAAHFENIDLHRIEFQLPFFDSEFLAHVVSLPLELCLGHKFYVKWLKLFAPAVTRVAWQAYPGHEPCPIPVPHAAVYQWDDSYYAEQSSLLKRKLLEQARQMLSARDFPREILKRSYLRLASLIYRAGWRDYSYVIQSAWKYFTYSKLCGGKYAPWSSNINKLSGEPDTRSQGFKPEAKLTSSAVE